jgi:hypothetical protein
MRRVSLFFLCYFSVFALILSRFFLVFRARNVGFCWVLKTDLFFSFSSVKSQVLTGFQNLSFSKGFLVLS